MRIVKAKETMTSKERVIKTFRHEKTDRVPIDYAANPTIHHKLCEALGIKDDDFLLLYEALGVDYREIWPKYVGPLIYPAIESCKVNPEYGFYTRWIANQSGGYEDFCHFPLKDADEEKIRSFPFPSPDDYDYETALDQMEKYKNYGVYVGHAGISDIINSTGRVMGMEDALVNLFTEDEATLAYVEQMLGVEFGVMERLLDKAKGKVDFVFLGEDLGTQIAPMISMEMYRRVIKPNHKRFVDLAASYNLPVMIHTCGSSSWAYEDFIEIGVQAVDTLQPEAANMSPRYLKDHFGGRLSFHGCISTTGALASGTKEDVIEDVKKTLSIMMPGGGYHFAPTHQIQDNSPVENVIAMYQAAHTYGVY